MPTESSLPFLCERQRSMLEDPDGSGRMSAGNDAGVPQRCLEMGMGDPPNPGPEPPVAAQAATMKLKGSSKRRSPFGRDVSATSPGPVPTKIWGPGERGVARESGRRRSA